MKHIKKIFFLLSIAFILNNSFMSNAMNRREYEPNDSKITAEQINIGDSYTGTVSYNDMDYAKIQLYDDVNYYFYVSKDTYTNIQNGYIRISVNDSYGLGGIRLPGFAMEYDTSMNTYKCVLYSGSDDIYTIQISGGTYTNRNESYSYTICIDADKCANGHNQVNVPEKKATCATSGHTSYIYCADCQQIIHNTYKNIPATGHQHTCIKNQKSSTYLSAGYTGDTYCSDCGQLIKKGENISKLKATNHKLSVKSVSYTYSAKKLKSKKITFNLIAKSSTGKITYKIATKSKKYISVTKNGKVSIKKGCPKGIYKISIIVPQSSDGKYKKVTKTVTVRVK